MYDDYDTVTPGHKAYNFKDFYEKLELFFMDSASLKDTDIDYNTIKKMYNKHQDSDSAKRTFNCIKECVNI